MDGPSRSGEPGLSETELLRAEQTFGLTFPPLLREVLGRVHPVRRYVSPQPWHPPSSPSYPDWRLRDVAGTRSLIAIPADGVVFDVEENDFWWHAWGPRPEGVPERLTVARREVALVPELIPLFGHLYVAASDDSPVFRIIQTDVRLFALALAGLADVTDEGPAPALAEWPVGVVPFWSDLHAYAAHRDTESPFAHLATGGF
ncbi:hypothetical protein Apa02nite_065220 [Actinoplanes palleronii]|uniref:SUKH-4 immunity protein of toxin-antitoxin system n=1 Tax=Actinoplanes palleronii TaxID=113570 RepID=A0ABQ4BI94_9ACTN|nr:hypothetical protein Apa02nite_065220 [Actinoplanes palleronii]